MLKNQHFRFLLFSIIQFSLLTNVDIPHFQPKNVMGSRYVRITRHRA